MSCLQSVRVRKRILFNVVDKLKKLADYFGVSIEYFLEDDAG